MNTTRRLAVLLALSSLALVTNVRAQAPAADAPKPPKATMGSTVINWDKLEVKTTKTGARREVFDAPTATLNNFECHVTTLNPGEIPHQPHRHPDEEMIVIKEGTLEVTINGQSQRAGPGSIFFYGSNDLHGMKNVGTTQATYFVFRFITPKTPPAPPAAPAAK